MDADVSPSTAREIVEALRDGVVPRAHVGLYTVGREPYLRALRDDLAFISHGGYKLRIVAGDWGHGKTHLLSLLSGDALDAGFAVAHVELHSREAPLERAEAITAAVVRSLVLPGGSGLEGFLRGWVSSFEPLDRPHIDRWLQEASPDLELRACLRHILASSGAGASDDIADVVRWLSGGSATQTLTRATGIRGSLRREAAPEVLTSILAFIHKCALSGTILMLDEAEAITSLTRSEKRDQANMTIKRLVDNPDQRRHLEIIFATTNRFIHDRERGARSYPALWERIRSYAPTGILNPRATVLQLAPLSEAHLKVLATSLLALHSAAYGWGPTVTGDELLKIGMTAIGEAGGGPPRRFVRTVITALDLLENNSDISLTQLVENAVSWREDDA